MPHCHSPGLPYALKTCLYHQVSVFGWLDYSAICEQHSTLVVSDVPPTLDVCTLCSLWATVLYVVYGPLCSM